MVACPHEVENTKPIGEVAGTHIDQVFLGSCANAKYEDLAVAAGILRGRRIHPDVRFIITPGSKEIMLEAMRTGVLATLVESGGTLTNPGCRLLDLRGLPFYLRCFSPSLSIEQNLAATVFDELGLLFREPDFLLREELREVSTYNAILLALAAGSPANSEISKATGIGDRALHYYLSTLVELGYMQRRFPLTGAPPTARQVRYSLEDPLLRFWFRFVYPNLSLIARLGAARAVRELVLPELDSYFGYGFERLCREALPALYAHESVRAGFEVGEYWDKDTQIDVVGLRQDNWTDLGECKWGHVPSATALRSELSGRFCVFPMLAKPHSACVSSPASGCVLRPMPPPANAGIVSTICMNLIELARLVRPLHLRW